MDLLCCIVSSFIKIGIDELVWFCFFFQVSILYKFKNIYKLFDITVILKSLLWDRRIFRVILRLLLLYYKGYINIMSLSTRTCICDEELTISIINEIIFTDLRPIRDYKEFVSTNRTTHTIIEIGQIILSRIYLLGQDTYRL